MNGSFAKLSQLPESQERERNARLVEVFFHCLGADEPDAAEEARMELAQRDPELAAVIQFLGQELQETRAAAFADLAAALELYPGLLSTVFELLGADELVAVARVWRPDWRSIGRGGCELAARMFEVRLDSLLHEDRYEELLEDLERFPFAAYAREHRGLHELGSRLALATALSHPARASRLAGAIRMVSPDADHQARLIEAAPAWDVWRKGLASDLQPLAHALQAGPGRLLNRSISNDLRVLAFRTPSRVLRALRVLRRKSPLAFATLSTLFEELDDRTESGASALEDESMLAAQERLDFAVSFDPLTWLSVFLILAAATGWAFLMSSTAVPEGSFMPGLLACPPFAFLAYLLVRRSENRRLVRPRFVRGAAAQGWRLRRFLLMAETRRDRRSSLQRHRAGLERDDGLILLDRLLSARPEARPVPDAECREREPTPRPPGAWDYWRFRSPIGVLTDAIRSLVWFLPDPGFAPQDKKLERRLQRVADVLDSDESLGLRAEVSHMTSLREFGKAVRAIRLRVDSSQADLPRGVLGSLPWIEKQVERRGG